MKVQETTKGHEMLTNTVHLLSGLSEEAFAIAIDDELRTLAGQADDLVAALHTNEPDDESTGFQVFDIDTWDE